jgi:hypothetical protein
LRGLGLPPSMQRIGALRDQLFAHTAAHVQRQRQHPLLGLALQPPFLLARVP